MKRGLFRLGIRNKNTYAPTHYKHRTPITDCAQRAAEKLDEQRKRAIASNAKELRVKKAFGVTMNDVQKPKGAGLNHDLAITFGGTRAGTRRGYSPRSSTKWIGSLPQIDRWCRDSTIGACGPVYFQAL